TSTLASEPAIFSLETGPSISSTATSTSPTPIPANETSESTPTGRSWASRISSEKPFMFEKRFFVEGLAQASYLFGSNGQAAVVAPNRYVNDYIETAAKEGLKIVAIFETHPHADFASGHAELAQRTGAKIYVSRRAAATYEHVDADENTRVQVGALEVQ